MNAALMRECIAADDGLVVLHRERRGSGHHFRRPRQHGGVDLAPPRKHVVAHIDRHHDFFQRGIACPLADAVDGAFDLPRAAGDAGQRVRHRHAEIVMAVHREYRLVGIRHPFDQGAHEAGIFLWRGVADGVGDIDRGRAGLDHGLDDPAEVVHLAAGGVFGRPFDVVDLVAGAGDVGDRELHHLFRRHVEFDAHVQR